MLEFKGQQTKVSILVELIVNDSEIKQDTSTMVRPVSMNGGATCDEKFHGLRWMSQSRFLLELQHGGRRTKARPLWV